jgi:predicted CoA-binding protein
MAIVDDIAGLRRILTRSRVIAVVGLSAHWYRPSYFAAKYMQEHGYRVIPVNPTQAEILGERSYPSLDAVPEAIDIVDCFRAPSQIEPIARAAIAKGAKVLWMQLGIRNDDAARIACEAGLDVVMNRCVKIEHGRLMGGLHWAGVNTGVISARRGGQHEPDGGHPGPLPSSAADGAAPLQCSIPAPRQ